MSNTNNWSLDYEDNIKDALKINALISIIVIIISVVVLFLIYALRHHPALRWLTMGGADDAQTNTHEPPPKKGLEPSVIAALPTFVYKKSGRDDDPGAECAICLTDLEEKETARLLPNCNHVFHVECIDMWLHSNSTCPICRSGAEPSAAEEREGPALASESLESAEDAVEQSSKVGGSGSTPRLSSFRRMLSWERSDRRLQSDVEIDLERQ